MLVETLRNAIRTNPFVLGGLAVGVIIVAAVSIVWQSAAPATPPPAGAYFFDEETGETVVRSGNEIAPLPGKSGKLSLVRADYFCTENNGERWIGYLEKIDDSAVTRVRDEIAERSPGGIMGGPTPLYRKSLLVRLPKDGSPWVNADSPEGLKITTSIHAPGNPAAKVYRVDVDAR